MVGTITVEVDPGFPAWAGIDPGRMEPERYPWGLPRVGGDRPFYNILNEKFYGASPRGRG